MDNKKCRKCLYKTTLGHISDLVGCYYIGRTGHRRPCPAGEKCTVFVPEEDRYDNREQFFADDVVTYGQCNDWHKEDKL